MRKVEQALLHGCIAHYDREELKRMSAGPKSILKKRPHAAVEPEAEERPLAPGQTVSDEPIHPVNGKGKDVEDADAADADEDDDDEDDESDDQSTADEDEFSVGSDDESGADEDDEDAIREMLEDGQERPAKSTHLFP